VPRVVALYRYPVKGLTPEACETLTVLEEGRIAGDRALGFRFASCAVPDEAWSKKYEFVALVNTPALARLEVGLDHRAMRLRLVSDHGLLAEDALDERGRRRIAAALQDYVLTLAENPLAGHPERFPLRLVGDGVRPRYQDSEAGRVTLHSRESLASLAAASGDETLDERRFRTNIVIEGLHAWAEQGCEKSMAALIAAAKSSGSAQVTSCRAVSFPGSGFRRPCPARPYGGFDTTRSNEPGSTPGIAPRKSPGTATRRPSGQWSRKFRRAKSSRSSWRSTPVPASIAGARRDRSSSRTPHPVPRSRTAPRQRGAANPARTTESIEKRYPRSGCRMINRGESAPDCPPGSSFMNHGSYPGTRSSAPTGKMSRPVPIFG